MEEKKIVRVRLCEPDLVHNMHKRSIPQFVSFLNKLENSFNSYSNIRLEVEQGWSETEIFLSGERLETDEEYAARMRRSAAAKKREEDRAERKRKADLKKLAELQKKYPEAKA